ncbi:FAD-binding domain-containing protein [Phreatobacter sp.]|uniref:FAD-binding domain-containing protein n=1 Tax=Phreatobacter sp. TaxID=1966341 RepID=UPI0022C6A20D|nr:FAD-binding domain-containing protein [Phreatobacter sp.]MCZ8313746.1 deoxyribodipyrimidine photolyase [Phreatobacter sp.]
MADRWIGTRAAGLAAMEAFVPAMGRRYANGRNYDDGPGHHRAVSRLSPYIRRRLLTEQEVVAAAVAAHGAEGAEKFVQEVIWRTYFQGWLERRPQVWDAYVTGLAGDLAALDADRRLRRDVERAEAGATGIACFDAWANELVETGYLHNHARMWFASIWIFTLGLPWRIGADFFLRHLIDGDAASNTLGWRWVAGLHTRGKAYHAEAWNIATYTRQRFTPRDSDLSRAAETLEHLEPEGLPPLQPLRPIRAPEPGRPTALLITDEDGRVEEFDRDGLTIVAAATLAASALRSPRAVAEHVTRFEQEALADTAARADVTAISLEALHPGDLARWAAAAGATQIITPWVTRGPLHDWLRAATPALERGGIALCEWRRDWDAAIWPHATAGFFKVKQQIPAVLERFGIG